MKEVTGIQLKRVFGNNQLSITIEVCKELSEKQIGELARIHDMACGITEHPKYNSAKGLIYVHEYDIDNVDGFRTGL